MVWAAEPADRKGGRMAVRTDRVFAALGEPTRMRIVDILARSGPASASELARRFPLSRQGVAKHLAILSAAGVTVPRRSGRAVLHRLEPRALVAAAAWADARASSAPPTSSRDEDRRNDNRGGDAQRVPSDDDAG
jgi:DNA-binding transcriptional ArsR family regulator